MDVPLMQYPPGDPRIVDKIAYQLKSRGIFDQFRKECIADVDTKPAYQNLHQRVEGTVAGFLANQEWRSDLNKNQLRDSLRKHIHESGFLDIGVERIVDQVVNPKIVTVFLPQIEDVVYQSLGLEKPKKGQESQTAPMPAFPKPPPTFQQKLITLKDLLPTDLDPISPESDGLKDKDDVTDDEVEQDDGANDDEKAADEEEASPPFELIEEINSHCDDNSVDSHLSGISELTSHDSQMSNNSSNSPSTKIPVIDLSNHDSQLSKVSSGSRLSIVFSDDMDKRIPKPPHSPPEIDITNDESQLSKISLQIINHEYNPPSDNNEASNQGTEENKVAECIIVKDSSSDASNLDTSSSKSPSVQTCESEKSKGNSVDFMNDNCSDRTNECVSKSMDTERPDKKQDTSKEEKDKSREKKDDRKRSNTSADKKSSDTNTHLSESDKRRSDKDKSRRERSDSKNRLERSNKHGDKDSVQKDGSKDRIKLDERSERDLKKEKSRSDTKNDKDTSREREKDGNKNVTPDDDECERGGKVDKVKYVVAGGDNEGSAIQHEEQIEKDTSEETLKYSDKSETVINKVKEDHVEKLRNEDNWKIKDKAKAEKERYRNEEKQEKSKPKHEEKFEKDGNKERSRHEEKSEESSKERSRHEDRAEKEGSRDKSRHENKSDKTRQESKPDKEKSRHDSRNEKDAKDKQKHEEKSERESSKDRSRKEASKDRSKHSDKNEKDRTKHEGKLERSKSKQDVREGKDEKSKSDDKSKVSKEKKVSHDEVDGDKKDKSASEIKKDKTGRDKSRRDDRGRTKHDEKHKDGTKTDGKEKDGSSKQEKSNRDRSNSKSKGDGGKESESKREEKSSKDKSSKSQNKGKENIDKKQDRKRDDSDSGKSSRSSEHKSKEGRKKEVKSKGVVDDHPIHRDKHSDDRRSTDRDSNGTARGRPASSRSNGSGSRHEKRENSNSSNGNSKSDGGGNSESSGSDVKCTEGLDCVDAVTPVSPTSSLPFKKRPLQQPQECESRGEYSCINNAGKLILKIKKPKIAANIFEARKLMHLRKSMANMERKRQKRRRHGVTKNRKRDTVEEMKISSPDALHESFESDDEPLLFFTEEEVNVDIGFIQYVRSLEESEILQSRKNISQISSDSSFETIDEGNSLHSSNSKLPESQHVYAKVSSSDNIRSTKYEKNLPANSELLQTKQEVQHIIYGTDESEGKPLCDASNSSKTGDDTSEITITASETEGSSSEIPDNTCEITAQTSPHTEIHQPKSTIGSRRRRSGFKRGGTRRTLNRVSINDRLNRNEIRLTESAPMKIDHKKLDAIETKPLKRNNTIAHTITSYPESIHDQKSCNTYVLANSNCTLVLNSADHGNIFRKFHNKSVVPSKLKCMSPERTDTTDEDMIRKGVVEVNVLEIDGDQYSSFRDNNNIDKSSSDDEKCGDGMSLSNELILPALRDLMLESGLQLGDSISASDNVDTSDTSGIGGDIPTPESQGEPSEKQSAVSTSSGSSANDTLDVKRPRLGRSRRVGLGRPPSNKGRVATPPVMGSDFVMPLSPESDVSASSGEHTRKISVDTTGQIRDGQGVTIVPCLLLEQTTAPVPAAEAISGDDRRHLRSTTLGTPVGREQVDNTEELIKPRPLFGQSSRRNRAQMQHSPAQGPVINCVGKRRSSTTESDHSSNPKRLKR